MPISQMTERWREERKLVKVTPLEGAIKDLHPGCLVLGSALTSLLFCDQGVEWETGLRPRLGVG